MGNLLLHKKEIILFFLCNLFFFGCNKQNQEKIDFGFDQDYFLAIQDLNNNKENEAKTRLKRCIKNGSYYCAKKSMELLTTVGSISERANAYMELVSKYDDLKNLEQAVDFFYNTNEYGKVLSLTQSCDFKTASNKIIRQRLQVLKAINDVDFEKSVYKWFTIRALSDEHYKFYRDNLLSDNEPEKENLPQKIILQYRFETYKKNYTFTYNNSQKIIDLFLQDKEFCIPQLFSDVGKAFLYGSANYVNSANNFSKLATNFADTPQEYYCWFYAGRLYDKADIYYTQSQTCFKNAMKCAATSSEKDNALWYLLSAQRNYSLNNLISSIVEYAKEWDNPKYFDDFFENFITSLLASGKWDALYDLYKNLDGYATDEIVAQMAYIYARLCQENLATGTDQDIIDAYHRALKSKTAIYYKIMAALKLNLSKQELESLLCESPSEKILQIDENAQKLLLGYMYYGLPQYIYPSYLELYKNGISTDISLKLADFLQQCGNSNNVYYPQSLRIASRANLYGNRDFTRAEMQLLFPKDYQDIIDEMAKKYGVSTQVMYALIRSESFFDSGILSTAEARGLAQLVDSTAADIARELKISEYSLTDPKTNVEFGTYYLSKQKRLFEGSYLNAFYSYNAGRKKVLRWLGTSALGFGKKEKMPADLFLETIPISETREYGRKLVSATAMYYWIYDDDCYDLNFLNELFFQ